MTANDDQFRDLLDRWEDLREQGQEPSVEELCRDAPHLAERLREWTRVLKTSDWMSRRADEVADETQYAVNIRLSVPPGPTRKRIFRKHFGQQPS